LVTEDGGGLSVRRQCELLGLPRSSFYYTPVPESEEDLCWMRLIDEEHLRRPFCGSRKMTEYLRGLEYEVNRKHVQRLMRTMGIQALYPKKTTIPAVGHKICPYLLRGVKIVRVFTSEAFTKRLEAAGIAVSMDGRKRALDNVFIERLWRTVKYEDIYLKDYTMADELIEGLERYFTFYDQERFHQALDYRTPWQVYREGLAA
jgi:transposase InsO family protein